MVLCQRKIQALESWDENKSSMGIMEKITRFLETITEQEKMCLPPSNDTCM